MKTKGWNACAAALLIVLAGVSAKRRQGSTNSRRDTRRHGRATRRPSLCVFASRLWRETYPPLDLRDSLLRGDMSPEQRAANALALLDSLVPGGDPARWNEVAGFWRPREIPKPLAPSTSEPCSSPCPALSPMDDPERHGSRENSFSRFSSNPAAALLFATIAPRNTRWPSISSPVRECTPHTASGKGR